MTTKSFLTEQDRNTLSKAAELKERANELLKQSCELLKQSEALAEEVFNNKDNIENFSFDDFEKIIEILPVTAFIGHIGQRCKLSYTSEELQDLAL